MPGTANTVDTLTLCSRQCMSSPSCTLQTLASPQHEAPDCSVLQELEFLATCCLRSPAACHNDEETMFACRLSIWELQTHGATVVLDGKGQCIHKKQCFGIHKLQHWLLPHILARQVVLVRKTGNRVCGTSGSPVCTKLWSGAGPCGTMYTRSTATPRPVPRNPEKS